MSFISSALSHTVYGAYARASKVICSSFLTVAAALILLPGVSAQGGSGYTNLNSSAHTYNAFVAGPVDENDPNADKIRADVNNFIATSLDWAAWKSRTDQIRLSSNRAYCVGNLSIALNGLGAAYQAGASGATTLLTLLPTAGVLIGAPAKELWVLYKLVPVAGVLSMMLSLGGNIVPMEVNEYERTESFSYQGMIGTHHDEPTDPEAKTGGMTQAERFAREVSLRANNNHGSSRSGIIFIGIVLQSLWLSCILVACWFVQTGGIVVWWCDMANWAFFWFGFVILSSLLENIAGVPFSRQWTIRVSRAPKVRISDDAPWVIREERMGQQQSDPHTRHSKTPAVIADVGVSSSEPSTLDCSDDIPDVSRRQAYQSHATYTSLSQGQKDYEILEGFKKGYNTMGRVLMDANEPWSAHSDPFYVLISIKGVQPAHAALRVFSKFLSIGVFTVGTALFASSALITILAAVVTAALIVTAGVFGRVTAMWMASVIMQDKPVIQRVVATEYEAEQYMDAMLRIPDCSFEIQGYIVLNGRCIKRYGHHLRWSKFLGVLARPYDVTRLAVSSHRRP